MSSITRKLVFSLLLVLPAACGEKETTEETTWQAVQACGLDDGTIDKKDKARLGACDPDETHKTTICHVPPGNPANAHTLCIGTPAVKHHLKNHEDYLGPCKVETPCPPGGGAGGSGGATGGAGGAAGSSAGGAAGSNAGGTAGTTGAGGAAGSGAGGAGGAILVD